MDRTHGLEYAYQLADRKREGRDTSEFLIWKMGKVVQSSFKR